METNLEIKDALYYSDLMYELKTLANLNQEKNEIVEQRIAERRKDIEEKPETGNLSPIYSLSDFQLEIFEIVRGISKKAGVSFKSPGEISKYPELVIESLVELENKKNELNALKEKNEGPTLIKKLTLPKHNI